MRWTFLVIVTVCILLGAYFVSPLIALHNIATAVETRDAVSLSDRIEWSSLRRSFRKQLVAAYLERTDKKLPVGFGRRFAISIADPVIARQMTIAAMLDLLGKGKAGENAQVHIQRAPFTEKSFQSDWRLWLNIDHSGRNVTVHLPPYASRDEEFRVHLRLIKWHWKLVNVDLPEDLKEQLTRELIELTKGQK